MGDLKPASQGLHSLKTCLCRLTERLRSVPLPFPPFFRKRSDFRAFSRRSASSIRVDYHALFGGTQNTAVGRPKGSQPHHSKGGLRRAHADLQILAGCGCCCNIGHCRPRHDLFSLPFYFFVAIDFFVITLFLTHHLPILFRACTLSRPQEVPCLTRLFAPSKQRGER